MAVVQGAPAFVPAAQTDVHGAPLFAPPEQRWPCKPPQIPPSVVHTPAVQTPLAHWAPVKHDRPLQVPLGHSVAVVHALPAFVPPTQRPEFGQSAFELHGFAARLLQVSHMHLFDVNPTARQFGLAAVSDFVRVPVELVRSIGNVAIRPPESGGQSRLVLLQNRFGDVPLMSHVCPAF